MPNRQPNPLSATAWWILYCAFCNCVGWILSALHQLNAAGYLVSFGLAGVSLVIFRKQLWPSGMPRCNWRKRARRFRRLFPATFLALAIMAILGGVLHRPSNPDGLTQRIPRLLHWLAEERWFWIPNVSASLNVHVCGFEWLMAPMFALLKTDRWVFLYNGISYLLLPGLIYSFFTRVGVKRRVAWYWMWLVPAGYCYAVQAGSIGNDAAGAVFGVAALDFALRAKEPQRGRITSAAGIGALWLSLLAAALLSGIKILNLTLGLPWLIALWPSLPRIWQRPVASGIVGVFALLGSIVPISFLLHSHGVGWTGEQAERGMRQPPGAVVSVVGNALNLGVENLLPPVFPAGWWNARAYKLLPPSLRTKMEQGFEPGAAHLAKMEIQFEICAGLGGGITILLLLSWIAARLWRNKSRPVNVPSREEWHRRLVRWSAVVSLLVYMLKVDVSSPARLITPYYVPLLPLLLVASGHEQVVRRSWWRLLALVPPLLAAFLLIINPPRPLWPAKTMLAHFRARHPQSSVLIRAHRLYSAYADRWDALAAVRDRIPAEARNVAFVTFLSASSMETSLWRPFGQRRVWPMPRTVTRAELDQKAISFVVVGTDASTRENAAEFNQWLEQWSKTNGGKVVHETGITIRATEEPVPWYLIQLDGAHRDAAPAPRSP